MTKKRDDAEIRARARKTKKVADPQELALRRLAGQEIARRRLAAGLTQRDVAERLGLPFYTLVSQIEGGWSRLPPVAWDRWLDIFGIFDVNERRKFARFLFRHYEPLQFKLLFPVDNESRD